MLMYSEASTKMRQHDAEHVLVCADQAERSQLAAAASFPPRSVLASWRLQRPFSSHPEGAAKEQRSITDTLTAHQKRFVHGILSACAMLGNVTSMHPTCIAFHAGFLSDAEALMRQDPSHAVVSATSTHPDSRTYASESNARPTQSLFGAPGATRNVTHCFALEHSSLTDMLLQMPASSGSNSFQQLPRFPTISQIVPFQMTHQQMLPESALARPSRSLSPALHQPISPFQASPAQPLTSPALQLRQMLQRQLNSSTPVQPPSQQEALPCSR